MLSILIRSAYLISTSPLTRASRTEELAEWGSFGAFAFAEPVGVDRTGAGGGSHTWRVEGGDHTMVNGFAPFLFHLMSGIAPCRVPEVKFSDIFRKRHSQGMLYSRRTIGKVANITERQYCSL